ncbi:unnamed protein product [Durusdinium trenchii]|uniref:Uncharacterized protein n=1 Tax=Durusdinium trenchii TaxID=1381693 RepID=A0ABP0SH37_9DINO
MAGRDDVAKTFRIAWTDAAPEMDLRVWRGAHRVPGNPNAAGRLVAAPPVGSPVTPILAVPAAVVQHREIQESPPMLPELLEANVSFGALPLRDPCGANSREFAAGVEPAEGLAPVVQLLEPAERAGLEEECGFPRGTGASIDAARVEVLPEPTPAPAHPEEKEVCKLLEAVQTACVDLAQRLGTQRAIWKGQVPSDLQWLESASGHSAAGP